MPPESLCSTCLPQALRIKPFTLSIAVLRSRYRSFGNPKNNRDSWLCEDARMELTASGLSSIVSIASSEFLTASADADDEEAK